MTSYEAVYRKFGNGILNGEEYCYLKDNTTPEQFDRVTNIEDKYLLKSSKIVSRVISAFEIKTFITVEKAEGEKCDRCRNVCLSVGTFPHHLLLCDRCVDIIDKGVVEEEIAVNFDGFFWIGMGMESLVEGEEEYLPMTDYIDYWSKYGSWIEPCLETIKDKFAS